MLTPQQIREFAERGFVVVPGAVSAELVAAASRTIDAIVDRRPPDPQVRGKHFYWPPAARVPRLLALLTGSGAWDLAESLVGPGTLQVPEQVQVALNIPPYPHRPGRPHIDAANPPDPDLPGTFTMLAGILMSDQREADAGNLWVWPGTHLTHAEYFRRHGADSFFDAAPYPDVPLPEPEQICGRTGDLLLAHYLLGHNIGGNTSATVRRAVYFRLKRHGHDARWRDCIQQPWLDYDPVRELRLGGYPAKPGSQRSNTSR